MSYDDLVQRAWRNHTLLSVLLELTYSCNLDCILCYNDRKHRGRPLRLDQYRQLIDDLAKMAVLHLTLSGGEPLVHRNFWAIGSHARDRGFVMRIKSNGHAIRPRMARRLKQEIDPFVIEVSLHGACAATHDRQTRVDGSFSQLMRNIQAMLQVGIRVQLNVPLTRWNEAEINEMCALADQLGLLLQIDSDVTPRDDGHRGPFSIAVTKTGLRRLYELSGSFCQRLLDFKSRQQIDLNQRIQEFKKRSVANTQASIVGQAPAALPLILMEMSILACSGAFHWVLSTPSL